MAGQLSFPNPVNEVSARLVATGVVLLAGAALALQQPLLLLPLAYGFWARVLTGPTLSPLGRFVTGVATPWLTARFDLRPTYVPGPPKRFAQGIGAAFTTAAVILHFAVGATGAAYALVGVLTVFAFLEAAFGFCMGCVVFAQLMRLGVIPEAVCEQCNNIWSRQPA